MCFTNAHDYNRGSALYKKNKRSRDRKQTGRQGPVKMKELADIQSRLNIIIKKNIQSL